MRMRGGGEAELARQALGDLGPRLAPVVAPVDADVVLLVHPVAVGRRADELVHAEADLLVRARPVGAETSVARRPRACRRRSSRTPRFPARSPRSCRAPRDRPSTPTRRDVPGGWLAGSSQTSLPGWPASVLSSDHVSPPSRLSKIPGASAPTSTRPSETASVETFESFLPSVLVGEPFARERPRLAQVGAPPDGRPVPFARRSGVDRARPRVEHGVVDRPPFAEGAAHLPVATIRVALQQEAPLPGSDHEQSAWHVPSPPATTARPSLTETAGGFKTHRCSAGRSQNGRRPVVSCRSRPVSGAAGVAALGSG